MKVLVTCEDETSGGGAPAVGCEESPCSLPPSALRISIGIFGTTAKGPAGSALKPWRWLDTFFILTPRWPWMLLPTCPLIYLGGDIFSQTEFPYKTGKWPMRQCHVPYFCGNYPTHIHWVTTHEASDYRCKWMLQHVIINYRPQLCTTDCLPDLGWKWQRCLCNLRLYPWHLCYGLSLCGDISSNPSQDTLPRTRIIHLCITGHCIVPTFKWPHETCVYTLGHVSSFL